VSGGGREVTNTGLEYLSSVVTICTTRFNIHKLNWVDWLQYSFVNKLLIWRWVVKEHDVTMLIGFIWLRKRTSIKLLWASGQQLDQGGDYEMCNKTRVDGVMLAGMTADASRDRNSATSRTVRSPLWYKLNTPTFRIGLTPLGAIWYNRTPRLRGIHT
jgi:hypothetical protein